MSAAAGGTLAAGLGCRAGCTLEQVLEALRRALAAAGRPLTEVGSLHTADFKREEPALRAAAALLDKPLVTFSLEQLRAHAPAALSRSAHTLSRFGVPSIAETAALAGAAALGETAALPRMNGAAQPHTHGAARLLGARLSTSAATCALAERVFGAAALEERAP